MSGALTAFQGYNHSVQLFGWEPKNNITQITRSTSVVDSLAGIASLQIAQTAANVDMKQAMPGANLSEGTRYGFIGRARMAAAPTSEDAFLATFRVTRSTGGEDRFNVMIRQSDQLLELYRESAGAAGKGTTMSVVGSTAFPAASFEWVWFDVKVSNPSGRGLFELTVSVDEVQEVTVSYQPAAGVTYSSPNAYWGGYTGGTAPGCTMNYANCGRVSNIDGLEGNGRQWRIAVPLATVSGNGGAGEQDFSVVNAGADTQHYQAVDDTTVNDDTDYVWIDSTAAAEETEAMTSPTPPTGYRRLFGIAAMIRHKNHDGGKWLNQYLRIVFPIAGANQSLAPPDPGASYATYTNSFGDISVRGHAAREDLANWALGMAQVADASRTAQWRITTIAAEVCFGIDDEMERAACRGVGRGIMRGCR